MGADGAVETTEDGSTAFPAVEGGAGWKIHNAAKRPTDSADGNSSRGRGHHHHHRGRLYDDYFGLPVLEMEVIAILTIMLVTGRGFFHILGMMFLLGMLVAYDRDGDLDPSLPIQLIIVAGMALVQGGVFDDYNMKNHR